MFSHPSPPPLTWSTLAHPGAKVVSPLQPVCKGGWSGTCLVEPSCQCRGHGFEPACLEPVPPIKRNHRNGRPTRHNSRKPAHNNAGPAQPKPIDFFQEGSCSGGGSMSEEGRLHPQPQSSSPAGPSPTALRAAKAPPPVGRGWEGVWPEQAESTETCRGGLPWWPSGRQSACQCGGHRSTPWSGGIPPVMEQLSPDSTATEPELWSPGTATTEARAP